MYLKNYKNIKSFLINKKFDNCDSIQLNWVHMSDNNQIFYENKPLYERFTERGKNVVKDKYNKICYVKTIIRGHLKNVTIDQNHVLSRNISGCDGFGKISKVEGIIPALESSHAVAYAMKLAETKKYQSILVNLSGRGDKDIDFITSNFGYTIEEMHQRYKAYADKK